ncbi:hypothetical protein D9C01_02815 [Corynebacterium diphtheriae]|nr:hypothetical protein D9B34_02835 [Corynebacterium diphtheriae]RKX05827.1 hypothetical protein D9C01_02815 [Corynebacterium diphtheriae]RNF49516.1 hypothetical protein EFE07_02695 [Corynebacterium diphtheriae]
MSSHGGATELIPLTADTDGIQAVMGRDLHRFLEAPTRYNDWIGRLIEKYGFIAGQDFYSKMSKTTGGRPSEDHILTMDMAKEISMVQNNEKGKQARRYFIECERKAKTQHPAIPQTYAEALEAAATQARRAEELEAQQALNAPQSRIPRPIRRRHRPHPIPHPRQPNQHRRATPTPTTPKTRMDLRHPKRTMV